MISRGKKGLLLAFVVIVLAIGACETMRPAGPTRSDGTAKSGRGIVGLVSFSTALLILIVLVQFAGFVALFVASRRARYVTEWLRAELHEAMKDLRARNETLAGIVRNLPKDAITPQALESQIAPLRKQINQLSDRLQRMPILNVVPETQQMAVSVNPVPVLEPEESEESIQSRLQQLAADCLRSPATPETMMHRVMQGWRTEAFGRSDLPDAFVVSPPGRREQWLIPNTRSWNKFQDGDLFKVTGPDVPSARIVRIHRVPRVITQRGGYHVVAGGTGLLETSLD